jgi:molybdopterin converting factor small subunit
MGENRPMKITLRLFANLRKKLPPDSPRGHCELELADGATVRDVLKQMGIPEESAQMILVNGEQDSNLARPLHDGDTVSIFPPLAGGCSAPAVSRSPVGK